MTDPDCCLIAGFSAAAPAQIVHAPYAYAQDAIDQNKADKFNKHVLTHPPGDKAYACFMRRYDAEHLARHPKQKVAAIELPVSAEIPAREKRLACSSISASNRAIAPAISALRLLQPCDCRR
jgi:hypothetical protein